MQASCTAKEYGYLEGRGPASHFIFKHLGQELNRIGSQENFIDYTHNFTQIHF